MKSVRRHVVTASLAIASAIALTVNPVAAQNQQPPQSRVMATHGDWQKRCFDTSVGESCALTQLGSSREQTNVKAVMTLASSDKGLVSRFEVPIGVYLPAGLGLKIDGVDKGAIPFHQCFPDRCIAVAGMEPETIAALKRGAQVTLTIFANPESSIDVPISLSGITAGLNSLN